MENCVVSFYIHMEQMTLSDRAAETEKHSVRDSNPNYSVKSGGKGEISPSYKPYPCSAENSTK